MTEHTMTQVTVYPHERERPPMDPLTATFELLELRFLLVSATADPTATPARLRADAAELRDARAELVAWVRRGGYTPPGYGLAVRLAADAAEAAFTAANLRTA